MAEEKKCCRCGGPVDWEDVKETFEHTFKQADSWGMESLEEREQQVVAGAICSYDCFYDLD